jgi:hypothetical protein
MLAAYLPGNSPIRVAEVVRPVPGGGPADSGVAGKVGSRWP